MLDDLVTKGTREPYRMFTSRAEYRLLLREDNADFRLRDIGHGLGLVPDDIYREFCKKRARVEQLLIQLNEFKLKPESSVIERLKELASPAIRNITSLAQLLRRNEILFEHLRVFDPGLDGIDARIAEEVETRIKYEGYIERQNREVKKLKRMEDVRFPDEIDYETVYGLSTEVREKLSRVRPVSLGQASRISGMTPAALMAIQVHLKRVKTQGNFQRSTEG